MIWAEAPRAGSKLRQAFEVHQILVNWAGVDLTRINGLGVMAAMKILREVVGNILMTACQGM